MALTVVGCPGEHRGLMLASNPLDHQGMINRGTLRDTAPAAGSVKSCIRLTRVPQKC